jgi:ankyrin repeat protein
LTDQLIFPKIDRCPVDRALNDAIDKEDITAVRTLAIEVLDLQDASTGFLIRAIKGNKRECALILMEILGTAKEMNHQDETGRTALHILVENEDEELLESILATRINVKITHDGLTALHVAIKNCSVPIVLLLLRHRHGKSTLAAYNASTSVSILSWAAAAGNDEVLRLLLETGREIFKDGKDIVDALRLVIHDRKRDLVGTLLVWARELEVDKEYPRPYCDWTLPDVEDMLPVFMGETLIQQAAEASTKKLEGKIRQAILENDIDKVEDLLNTMGVNSVSQHIARKHGTVLAAAALDGNTDMVRALISRGTPITVTKYDGNSAFENAAARGYEAILQLLLDNGANVNETTGYFSDGTALQRAAENGHIQTAQFLLDSGARIDEHGTGPHNGETALIRATQSSFEDIARLLLLRNANIFARNRLGESVIHLAAKQGLETFLLQLMGAGAAVDDLTPTGNTVLMMAAENGLEVAITDLLSKHELVRDQINLRGGNWYDADGYNHPSSALFRAASNGYVGTVEVLLQFGARVNATSEHGQTALAVAKQNGHSATADVLRSYGAALIYDSLQD